MLFLLQVALNRANCENVTVSHSSIEIARRPISGTIQLNRPLARQRVARRRGACDFGFRRYSCRLTIVSRCSGPPRLCSAALSARRPPRVGVFGRESMSKWFGETLTSQRCAAPAHARVHSRHSDMIRRFCTRPALYTMHYTGYISCRSCRGN